MRLVSRLPEVEANIRLLLSYLDRGDDSDGEFARALITRGICFVVVRLRGVDVFAPSRFVGYVGNSRRAHARAPDIDGRETNRALNRLLGVKLRRSRRLERDYQAFCTKLGITPRGV